MQQNPDVASWYKEPPYAYLDPCPRYIGLNTMVAPFDDKDIRQAISYAINRDQVVDIGWEGLTKPSIWLLPAYAPLKAYMDENKDLFEKYGAGEYNLDKVAEIMTGKGYTQDGEGFWVDAAGSRIAMNLIIRAGETDQVKMAPVVAELLQRGGFDATFTLQDIAAFNDALSNGRANSWLDVACGSVAEPYATMDNFHSRHVKPIGELATGARSRWSNAEYDKLVDEMAVTSPDDPKLHELFRQALDIWLAESPSVPLVEASLLSSFNNKYWTNWPTEDNNYVHPGHWWATALLLVMEVEPAQ
jgi:peptide/nickel transport system substrate-binding protein